MRERIRFYWERIKAGRIQEMILQTKWIYGYARHYWVSMAVYTVLGLVGSVISLASGLVSKDLVDIITGHQVGEVLKTFILMVSVNLGTVVVNQLSNFASTYISMKVNNEIKADIFEKILVTDWESLTSYHTGDLLTRWGSDASNIADGVLNFIPNIIIYLFRFISAFAMVVYYDASFAFFAFIGLPVTFLMSRSMMKRMVENNKRSAAVNAKVSGFNQEAFSNIQVIKAFDLVRLYVARLKELQKEYVEMRVTYQKMSMVNAIIMTMVGMLVSYSSYGWGIYRVWSGGITYGTMTMFLGLSGTLTATLNSLTSLVPMAISLTTSAGRLMDIVEMPREDYSDLDEAVVFKKKHRDEGISLYIGGVSYTYKTGTEVFKRASMKVHPHEVVALVGPSGEGKTTMIRLILSLIPFSEGSAYFTNGKNEKDDPGAETIRMTPATRCFFSYVPQGNTMFSGTIAYNMRTVKPDATDEEIIQALKLACAWDFVERLPDGINSEIKERGGGFSEGQAQRMSIARALLRRSPILLLDEATSALDVATERRVLKNITRDDYPRACIVTTHRPSVLSMCERVYQIRNKECHVMNEEEVETLVRQF